MTRNPLAGAFRGPTERIRGFPDAFTAWLTRGRLIALVIGAAALVAIIVLVGVLVPGWSGGDGGAYAPKTLVSATSIAPRSSLFGDVLTAQVRVVVDPRRYAPATIQLDPKFSPYAVRSQSRRVEGGIGRATAIVFTYAIECLTRPCISLMSAKSHTGAEAKTVVFAPVQVTGRMKDGTGFTERVDWPSIVVHSRLSATEVALATPQANPTPTLSAVSWRISPNLLGALAVAGAVVLVLSAGWLLASIVLRDSRLLIRRFRIPGHLTPVERALLLAQHAAKMGELDEERKALQRLAVELRRTGRGELAGRAGRLAWSEQSPSPEVVGALADAVRSNGAH